MTKEIGFDLINNIVLYYVCASHIITFLLFPNECFVVVVMMMQPDLDEWRIYIHLIDVLLCLRDAET